MTRKPNRLPMYPLGASESSTFTWNTSLTYTGTNPGKIYGGNTSGDDLVIYGNNTDAKPYIYLYGNLTIEFVSAYHILANLPSTTNTHWFAVLNSTPAFCFRVYGDATTELYGSLTYKGTNPFYLYGGDTTGDDFWIRANSVDAKPYIYFDGAGVFYVAANTEIDLRLGDNAGSNSLKITDSDAATQWACTSDGATTQNGNATAANFLTGGSATVSVNVSLAGVGAAGDFISRDGSTGHSGTFTDGGGQTVTVKNGIITGIV